MHILPGMFVRHPTEDRLGLGRVQTVLGNKITVNFENVGKIVINGNIVKLVVVEPNDGR
ncbi:MAG: DUF3553 domain-containing protein [Pseudomonadota bacterium]|nr:DUF3553 domain-containing protein [Pseudomonadota bacterium]